MYDSQCRTTRARLKTENEREVQRPLGETAQRLVNTGAQLTPTFLKVSLSLPLKFTLLCHVDLHSHFPASFVIISSRMAVASSLTTQLVNKLNENDVTLEKKLELCRVVFTSSTIPIIQKEDIVLDYIISCLKSDLGSNEKAKKDLFSCLKFCISSNRMKNFKGNLRPGVVDGVLQVISSENEICMNDTIIDILTGQYFQRWLCCDVPGLCLLLGSFFSKAKRSDCQDAIKVLGLFQHINRISLLKEEIKERFVEEVFEPLAFALSLFQTEELDSFKSSAITTVVKILLSDMSFVNNFIVQMKLHSTESMDTTEGKDIKNFCSKIKKLPKNETVDNVSSAYTLFLEAVAQSDLQKESSDKVFQVFMLLCKPLGLRVDKMISISISPVKNWTHEESFKVIGDLICVLEKFNIPLSIDFESYTSQTWLISLVVGMTNINLDSLSPSLLTMIKNSFKYNNLIIETCIDTITNVMLRPKSQELIPFYEDLMKAVFEGSSKAQRFQKIVTLFLPKIKSVLNTFTLEVNLDEVFPCRVSEAFSDVVFSLAHSQVLAIMKSFLFHLERDCLDFINSSDIIITTNFGIICKMLILMFNSVKIADHSTPDVIQEKFNNLMHDLEVLLGKFGTIFIDFHNDDLLKRYLDLCHSYGAMKLMMDDYNWNPMKKLTLPDNYPTNLTYVHSYLDPESWDAIATQTIKHEECSAKFLIYKLLIQKIQAVSQVEEGEEGPGAQAARYILDISETAWLWDDIIALSSHFENKELIKLIRRLVHEAGSNQSIWKSVVSKEAFKENRRLVLATALRHLRKCAKILNETDDTLLPNVISYLNDETILEYELSILIIEDMELEENIKESLNNMVEVINNFLSKEKSCVLKKIPHQSFIEVIEQLPIHYMSNSSQNCLFLSILSLLVDLPQNDHVDNIIFDILFRIVSSIRKNKSEFHGSLDSGLVLKFLSDRSKNYPLRMKFLKKFCSVSLSNFYSAKKLIKSVSAPNRDTIWLTTMVLRSLLQYKNNDEDDNKKQINTEKFINRLGSLCVSVLNSEKPHLSLLDDYTMSLAHCLSNESSELKSLLLHLPAYIQISMKNFNVGIELICQVIANKSEVEEYCVDNNMIKNTWNFLFEAEKLPNDSVIHLLLSKSTSSEFQIMLSLLNEKLENEIGLRREEFFSRIISLWSHVVTCGLNSEKSKIRQENILRLVKPLVEVFAGWVETNFGVEPIFEFLTTLAQSSGVVIKPVVVDLYLLALSSVPLGEDLKTLMANFSFAADALFALYLYRANLILDRLPVFLQRYRRFLYALVPCGHPNNDSTIILETTLCADKLERIAKAVGKRQKDLTRIAPYLVADLLDIFEKYQLHADIKLAYTNITYIFLNLCDNHGITYLEATLSPALFKSIHDNYKKYYRYVGKI